MVSVRHILLLLIALSCSPILSKGQIISAESINHFANERLRNEVFETYQIRQFRPGWSTAELRSELEGVIADASAFGLVAGDYPLIPYGGKTGEDSVKSEIKYTEAALRLLSDLQTGNRHPDVAYRGLGYKPGNPELPALLSSFLDQKNFTALAARVQPTVPEYHNAIRLLKDFQKTSEEPGFYDIKVTSLKPNTSNLPLAERMKQLGLIEKQEESLHDSVFRHTIIAAQKRFGLLSDGKIRSTFLAALNEPLGERIEELTVLLNIIRWSGVLRSKGPSILLNIPSSDLIVYENGGMILYSKVITGKKSTPTPTLTSTIEEIILYPYWVVPYKIATGELLPKIKRNVSYMERNHFQVIDSRGRQLDPRSIRWRSLSSSYFPYTLRQSTGCDNSLGLIKFDFPNPFSVYLHDTPGKELFEMNRRFFSHGCMRVEKPVELAHILLDTNKQAIDTLTEKGCLFNQKPIPVKAEKKAALTVLYSTAWYNESGEIILYEDVYQKRKSK